MVMPYALACHEILRSSLTAVPMRRDQNDKGWRVGKHDIDSQ